MKVSIDGETLLSPLFGMPDTKVSVEKHFKGLPGNSRKAVEIFLIVQIWRFILQCIKGYIGVELLPQGLLSL